MLETHIITIATRTGVTTRQIEAVRSLLAEGATIPFIARYRKEKTGPFLHFDLFNTSNWGLIVYDEVHLLPAPVFRMTSEIQSKRRLGLTATLIREDGMETDVFSRETAGSKTRGPQFRLDPRSGRPSVPRYHAHESTGGLYQGSDRPFC